MLKIIFKLIKGEIFVWIFFFKCRVLFVIFVALRCYLCWGCTIMCPLLDKQYWIHFVTHKFVQKESVEHSFTRVLQEHDVCMENICCRFVWQNNHQICTNRMFTCSRNNLFVKVLHSSKTIISIGYSIIPEFPIISMIS